MKHTEFLGMNLPEDADPVEVSDFSDNFQMVDTQLAGGGGFPPGGIIIWSGAADNVPDGWALCDGSNGTPDLRGRFVLGAGGEYDAGTTGGEAKHTLSANELPHHYHGIQCPDYDANNNLVGLRDLIYKYTGSTTASGYAYYGLASKYAATSFARFTGVTKLTTLGISSSEPAGQPHNNIPPYYALCYIMKL